MLEDALNLYEADEDGWCIWSVCDNVLKELSDLSCNEDTDDSDPLRLLFQQQEVDIAGEMSQHDEHKVR
jgi:hypothetical protein